MARPASNLHLQPKNGGWRARVLVPVELQGILGKKLFHTPVWRVTKSEAAVLAYPEVRKFEALIDRARSGGGYCEAVEVEVQGPLNHLALPSVRGVVTAGTETSFTALIAEWVRKKRINNPQTQQQRKTHFKSLADFLGHDDGAKVTSQNIVAFEKMLETTPDPRTGKLRHPNTVLGYLSVAVSCRAGSLENRGTVARRPTPAFNPQRLADPDKQTPLRRDRHPMPAWSSCN
jgi:hypothetical protein